MHVNCIYGIVVFTFLHNYEIVYSVVANYACIRLNWFGVLDYGLEL